jgi:hypothetical protein
LLPPTVNAPLLPLVLLPLPLPLVLVPLALLPLVLLLPVPRVKFMENIQDCSCPSEKTKRHATTCV